MSTQNCNKKLPCGCDEGAHKPGVVCNTENCENPDPCPETFSAGCVVWTGDNLICNSTVIAQEGDRMETILERMVALFCGPAAATPPIADINLLHPLPNELIFGTDDHVICVDRINCFEDLTLSFDPVTAPPGIMFQTTGPVISDTISMTNDLSCVHFDLDISVAQGNGVIDFYILVTGCNDVLYVPAQITLP